MVCNRCQKRPAIIFVQRMENGQMKNEGFCLHCARELHIKPVEDLMKQFGMSDEDMDNMENRMESMMDEMGDANPLSLMMNPSFLDNCCPTSLPPMPNSLEMHMIVFFFILQHPFS